MTEGQGMKRARELEEAGAATEVTQGRVDDELEGIRQAIRGSRPSKVAHDKRRSIAAARSAAGVGQAIARPTALAAADAMNEELKQRRGRGGKVTGMTGNEKRKLKKQRLREARP
jgi:hypothetical protein